MRNYKIELENRIEFIRGVLNGSGASGIVFNNSGGKDCTLVGIICKMACDNTIGIMQPCESKRNFGEDMNDAEKFTEQFNIETKVIDITPVKKLIVEILQDKTTLNTAAVINIAPRIRMIIGYAMGASMNMLLAGTGNRSESYMGYFTKWGDGAYDFNPIADLTVTEVYEFLRYLGAPESIINKAPSAGLFEGQTDETEMGVTYAAIDNYILNGIVNDTDKIIIDRYHLKSEHKRNTPLTYGNEL
jgi:NAD+ synthetase